MNIQSTINSVLHNAAMLKSVRDRRNKEAEKPKEAVEKEAKPAASTPKAPTSPASAEMAARARAQLQERGQMVLDQNKRLSKLFDKAQKKIGSSQPDTLSRIRASLGQREKIRQEVEGHGIDKPGKRK